LPEREESSAPAALEAATTVSTGLAHYCVSSHRGQYGEADRFAAAGANQCIIVNIGVLPAAWREEFAFPRPRNPPTTGLHVSSRSMFCHKIVKACYRRLSPKR
jgi:hypothetical protein